MPNEPTPDAEVEAAWYDEVASALDTSAAEYRRLARLLRVAGGSLHESDFADARQALRRVNYRIVATLSVADDLTGPGSGVDT
jgi:hypothetical protein